MDNNSYYNNNGNYDNGNYNDPRPPKKNGSKVALIIVVCVLATMVLLLGLSDIKDALVERFGSAPEPSATVAPTDEPKAEEPADEPEKSEKPENDIVISNNSGIKFDDLTPEEVANKLIPSVVCIQNYIEQQTNDRYGFGGFIGETYTESEIVLAGEGSGIIVSEDGYIVTNCHVVNGADKLTVALSDDTSYDAKLIGLDEDTDLAVIKIDAEGLPPAELGDSVWR